MPDASACALNVRRRRSDYPGQATTYFVLRRLLETLDVIDRDTLIAETPGLTDESIEHLHSTTSTTVPWSIATPMDWAWAKHVKGHDLWAMEVRHGSVSTYRSYACRCEACSVASTRSEAKRTAGHKTAGSWADKDTVERVARHVDRLRTVGTLEAIAAAAGTHRDAIKKLSYREAGIQLGTAAKILAVTAADVADPLSKRMVPAGPSRHIMGTLRALGYTRAWMEEQVGGRNRLQQVHTRTQVTARTHHRLAVLAERVGDRRPAAHEVPPHIAEMTRRKAHAEGWFPPAAYDDDGNVDPRSIPGHKWALADEWCARQVEAHYRLSLGLPNYEAARIAGITPDSLSQRPRHGLVYNADGVGLDYAACGDRVRQYADVYARYEANEIGALTAAAELGIVRADFRTYWNDHPEVVAWVAAEQEQLPTSEAA